MHWRVCNMRALLGYVLVSVTCQVTWSFQHTVSWPRAPRVSHLWPMSATPTAEYSPPDLVEALRTASTGQGPLSVEATFAALGKHPVFLDQVWQRRPFYCPEPLPNLAGAFTMEDVETAIESDFLEAGRGTFSEGRSGWQMAHVGKPRGDSYEEAKLRFQDVETALREKSGTVVVNSAGAYVKQLAGVCLDCMEALTMPTALNLYLTAPGQATSAPPHTDMQDVFVLQTQGRKRWRVFAPPDPSLRPKAEPMARGKGKDILLLEELQEPLLDLVLSPGQVLYMPAGYPHTTDTVTNMADETDPSVHLTIGVDSHVWGLSYASLREYGMRRAGMEEELKQPLQARVSSGDYWALKDCLPLGFLGERIMGGHSRWSEMQAAVVAEIASNLVERLRAAEGEQWAGLSDEEVLERLQTVQVAERFMKHHARITATLKDMYGDVRYGLTDVPMDASFFRSKPYFETMEKTMEELVQWSAPPQKEAAVAAGAGAGAKTSGFGGMGGAAAPAGKKKKAKKGKKK